MTMTSNAKETGDIYLQDGDSEKLEKLNSLKLLHVVIIQRKATVNYFNRKLAYDIMDTSKNLIFRATRPKSFFPNKKACKISVKNLRNVKILNVIVEPTTDFESFGTEANVFMYPKCRIAQLQKYGGTASPACFEIFNVDTKTAFTIDNSAKSINSSTSTVEYNINTKTGTVGNIMMKTGLNFVLSTDPRMPAIEKATLICAILAMDLLQVGVRDRNHEREQASNQYLFN